MLDLMPLCKVSRQLYADRKVHKQRTFVVQQSLVILGHPKRTRMLGSSHLMLPAPLLLSLSFHATKINSQIILHLLLT